MFRESSPCYLRSTRWGWAGTGTVGARVCRRRSKFAIFLLSTFELLAMSDTTLERPQGNQPWAE